MSKEAAREGSSPWQPLFVRRWGAVKQGASERGLCLEQRKAFAWKRIACSSSSFFFNRNRFLRLGSRAGICDHSRANGIKRAAHWSERYAYRRYSALAQRHFSDAQYKGIQARARAEAGRVGRGVGHMMLRCLPFLSSKYEVVWLENRRSILD